MQETADRMIRTISPNEEMFQGSPAHYFDVGRSALESIELALRATGTELTGRKQILDLPCGHGRVLRYLRAAFPESEITACDLLRDGVDFCASTFDAVPLYSNVNPRDIHLGPATFDLIWVGSLLTHLDATRWREFLEVFKFSLRPGGLLVFTTHGREVYRKLVTAEWTYGLPYWRITRLLYNYEHSGFGYTTYLGAGSEYGMSLSNPAWVFAQIAKIGGLRTVHFCEKAWDNHQDCFAFIRDEIDGTVGSSGINLVRYLKHQVRELFPPKAI